MNLDAINKRFPGWATFVYLGADVPYEYEKSLSEFERVRIRRTNAIGHVLMMHRFLAIDEPGVDAMIVRDADSRIHHRDRWAIQEFIVSQFFSHSIRDHPYHTVPMLGGLWGMKKWELLPSIRTYIEPLLNTPWEFGMDQTFLKDIIYPILSKSMLVHTSQNYIYSPTEVRVGFPWAFSEACYCGKAEGNQSTQLLRIFRR